LIFLGTVLLISFAEGGRINGTDPAAALLINQEKEPNNLYCFCQQNQKKKRERDFEGNPTKSIFLFFLPFNFQ